ncbi:hypothetical protein NXZ75_21900 [Lysinibacillus sphaericus]|uniref:hypothetical protein n=1 Tax=Lysinibacillus sphaericus TaxID=1421 RepID=UPI002163862A|nr:hypothetical protein [Lysinibacillus sphaericus]MCS1384812.1 hypothetical protein [Lysinibacillus sphaericus]
MTEKNNQQNKQQNNQQTKKDNKGIEKRGYFEALREHDNSSLINIMQQINSDKDKKK